MKLEVKEYIPRSWWHPIGASILCKEFSARTPSLCNAVTICFTIDKSKFRNPACAWAAGVDRTSDFMEAFRKKYGPTEYFIGLEFQSDEEDGQNWPHWHSILLRRGTYDKEWITKQWGYGTTDVRRIYDETMDYYLKYVTKCLGDVPEWVLPLNRIRRVRYSKNFLNKLVSDAVAKEREKGNGMARIQRTIGERLADWASRVSVKCGDCTRSAQTRQPWKQILREQINKIVKLQAYEGFGVLAVETTNPEQMTWINKHLIAYRDLAKSQTESGCVACFSPPSDSGHHLRPREAEKPSAAYNSSMRFTPNPMASSKSNGLSAYRTRVYHFRQSQDTVDRWLRGITPNCPF